ncbi:hypothetical protein OHB56_20270 [Streptomyces sp. NBC_01635]|uniref:hypothetical protein n=1 Tax=Streptomyces sp. NBC_01635 TaxID=2975904 RepID=UPI0038704165|nr:hypothetical protein OHB56_20270 [Streptomyces sp. NBC_01635]
MALKQPVEDRPVERICNLLEPDRFESVRFLRFTADGTHARLHEPVVEVVVEAARPVVVAHRFVRAVSVVRDPAPAAAVVTRDEILCFLATRSVAARPVPAGPAAEVCAEAARVVAKPAADILVCLGGVARPRVYDELADNYGTQYGPSPFATHVFPPCGWFSDDGIGCHRWPG